MVARSGRETVLHEQRDGAVVVEDAAHFGGDAGEKAAVHVAAIFGERAEHRRVSAGGVAAYEYLVWVYAVFVRVRAHVAYRAARVLYLRGEVSLSCVAVLRYRDGEALFHDFVEAADRHIKILRLPRRALHVDEARIFLSGSFRVTGSSMLRCSGTPPGAAYSTSRTNRTPVSSPVVSILSAPFGISVYSGNSS